MIDPNTTLVRRCEEGKMSRALCLEAGDRIRELQEALDRVRELPLKITDDEPSRKRMAQLIEDAISG
jgi:hypothetical protein